MSSLLFAFGVRTLRYRYPSARNPATLRFLGKKDTGFKIHFGVVHKAQQPAGKDLLLIFSAERGSNYGERVSGRAKGDMLLALNEICKGEKRSLRPDFWHYIGTIPHKVQNCLDKIQKIWLCQVTNRFI